MELIYLKREQINDQQWNQMVNDHPEISVSNFTWYLDAISDKWAAYKAKDLEIYFPLPYLSGVNSKMLYQPIFSRVLSVISPSTIATHEFVEALKLQIPKDFKHYWFHADFAMNSDAVTRKYQKIEGLDGMESIEKGYSTNAKRILKKYDVAENDLLFNSNISEGLELIKDELGPKIAELKNEQFRTLNKLVTSSMKENGGYLVNLLSQTQVVACAYFITKGTELIYLKGAAKEEFMQKGAMYALMNACFAHFAHRIQTIDFDGSNIDSVAQFYYKLGGTDRTYFENKNTGKIPFQYSIIKKLF